MIGLETPAPVLGLWWRGAAAFSAVFVVHASLADNRRLALVTLALCAALIAHAFATIAEGRG
jgi:hypothetical protein